MESFKDVLENLSSTYVLAITTILAASIFAFFLGLRNYVEDEEPETDANGVKKKPKKKKPTHMFFLPCSLNQECLFDDDEPENSEEEGAEDAEPEVPTTKNEKLNNKSAANGKCSNQAEQVIKSRLTEDQLREEQMAQKAQLAEIYRVMEEESEKFGVTSMAEVEEQMKLYRG